jgi:hypothetical protein
LDKMTRGMYSIIRICADFENQKLVLTYDVFFLKQQ